MAGELAEMHNYAIYRDVWNGKVRFQGHWFNGTDWMPVAGPQDARSEAIIDCQYEHNANTLKRGRFKLDPIDRTFDWSGQRRNL